MLSRSKLSVLTVSVFRFKTDRFAVYRFYRLPFCRFDRFAILPFWFHCFAFCRFDFHWPFCRFVRLRFAVLPFRFAVLPFPFCRFGEFRFDSVYRFDR